EQGSPAPGPCSGRAERRRSVESLRGATRPPTAMNVVPIDILLVEDSPSDVLLTKEALRDARIANDLRVARDGEEAMAYLRQEGDFAGTPRPDIVILDLNLPRKDGREVLREIKGDESLRRI